MDHTWEARAGRKRVRWAIDLTSIRKSMMALHDKYKSLSNHYDTYVSVMFPRSSDIQLFDYLYLPVFLLSVHGYIQILLTHTPHLWGTHSPLQHQLNSEMFHTLHWPNTWGPALFSTGQWKIHLSYIHPVGHRHLWASFHLKQVISRHPHSNPQKWGKVQSC